MWIDYRRIIQAWDETIEKVAAADLPKNDQTLLQDAVLKGNAIDTEILSMLDRRPRMFHLGMLPSCRSDVTGTQAAEMAQAHNEASAARLKLFELELKADCGSSSRRPRQLRQR